MNWAQLSILFQRDLTYGENTLNTLFISHPHPKLESHGMGCQKINGEECIEILDNFC